MTRLKLVAMRLAVALTTLGGGWLAVPPTGQVAALAAPLPAPAPEKSEDAVLPVLAKQLTLFEPTRPPRSHFTSFTPVDAGRGLVVASSSLVQLFEVESGKELRAFQLENAYAACEAVAPDEKSLWVGYVDSPPHGWNLKTGEALPPLEDPPARTYDLSYSRDGRFIVAAGYFDLKPQESPPTVQYAVCVWGAKTARRLQRWVTGTGSSNRFGVAAGISGDGKRVAAGTPSGVIVWERESGKELWTKPVSTSRVVVTPDGKKLATADSSTIVQIWNAETGENLARIDDLPPGERSMRSMAISPDGSWLLVSVGDDGVRDGRYFTADCGLHVFDLASRKKSLKVELNALFNYGACFTADGRYMMAATSSGTIGSCNLSELLELMVIGIEKENTIGTQTENTA